MKIYKVKYKYSELYWKGNSWRTDINSLFNSTGKSWNSLKAIEENIQGLLSHMKHPLSISDTCEIVEYELKESQKISIKPYIEEKTVYQEFLEEVAKRK